jgi:membrane-anchored mycosin MYCP
MVRGLAVAGSVVGLCLLAVPASAASGGARPGHSSTRPGQSSTRPGQSSTRPGHSNTTAGGQPGTGSLPTPVGDCPPQAGSAAPAQTPWAQQALDYSSVWKFTQGRGVKVAVIDSGVDANPQFGQRVIVGPDLAGSQFSAAPDDADCVGHGTMVASIIAAAPMKGVSFAGVAPQATILSIKITNSMTGIPATVVSTAILDAVQMGANVINLSLAVQQNNPELHSAVDFAISHNVVVVAAAGNDDGNGTGPFYPAQYSGVLSVGAVNQDGSLASFSDTHTRVTVTAPGADVTGAWPGTFPHAYNPDDSGTSFATPFVAGVVALVRAYNPRLSATQVVQRIKATADGAAGPGTGNGMVNPVQAITAVQTTGSLSAGSGTHRGQVSIIRAAAPDRPARLRAMVIAAGAFGGAALVIIALIVIPAGRRRRWQPGRTG